MNKRIKKKQAKEDYLLHGNRDRKDYQMMRGLAYDYVLWQGNTPTFSYPYVDRVKLAHRLTKKRVVTLYKQAKDDVGYLSYIVGAPRI